MASDPNQPSWAHEEDMIKTFSRMLLSTEGVVSNQYLTAKVTKVTRDCLEKKTNFYKFKLKLLEEKKLEDMVLRVSARPTLLNQDLVEKLMVSAEFPDTFIKDERASLDVLETGLLFYIEKVLRELTTIAQMKEEKGLEFASKMVRKKFWDFIKDDTPAPEPTTMFSVVLQDPVEEIISNEKSRLSGEKETLEMLKSSPSSELTWILEDDIKQWENEIPKLEAKIKEYKTKSSSNIGVSKEVTGKKDKSTEEVQPVMLGKRKSVAPPKQTPVAPEVDVDTPTTLSSRLVKVEEKPKDGTTVITMDHVLHYLAQTPRHNRTALHQSAVALANRP